MVAKKFHTYDSSHNYFSLSTFQTLLTALKHAEPLLAWNLHGVLTTCIVELAKEKPITFVFILHTRCAVAI